MIMDTATWWQYIPGGAVLSLILLVLAYRYGCQRFGVWRRLGVPGPAPWPYLGTVGPMLIKGGRTFDQACVTKYGPVVGLYEGSTPVLLVSDLELLKQVFVKDFNSFMNRTVAPLFTDKDNSVFRVTLTRLMGDHWKHVRCHLTPTFSGAKLKIMIPQLQDCANILRDNLVKQATDNATNIKEFCGAFSMDVIARTAFGLSVDSQKNPTNPFVFFAKKVFETSRINMRLLLILLFPFLAKMKVFVGQSQFPPDVVEFFSRITTDAMERREENNESRVDFLQSMLDSRLPGNGIQTPSGKDAGNGVSHHNGHIHWDKQGLSHEEILAQSLLFFIAGYETTAATLTFMAYSLATNMDVQRKLQEEIDEVVGGQACISYEMLHRLPYLDMVVQETLRMYPPATRTIRACGVDTVLGGIPIKRGTLIAIPIYTLHHHPDHWTDPDKFIPERFIPEEKAARDPYLWIPFGAGPRNCIGMRLAMMEVKIAMATILTRIEFVVSKETQIPLQFKKNTILSPKEPIRLDIKLRNTDEH